ARQQEVLQLKFQNDLSYQQIADIMKTTANNVGVLLHTALSALRQRYGESARDFIPFKPTTTKKKMNLNDPKLTAYALDELDEPERSAISRAVAESAEAQRFVDEIRSLASALKSE